MLLLSFFRIQTRHEVSTKKPMDNSKSSNQLDAGCVIKSGILIVKPSVIPKNTKPTPDTRIIAPDTAKTSFFSISVMVSCSFAIHNIFPTIKAMPPLKTTSHIVSLIMFEKYQNTNASIANTAPRKKTPPPFKHRSSSARLFIQVMLNKILLLAIFSSQRVSPEQTHSRPVWGTQ